MSPPRKKSVRFDFPSTVSWGPAKFARMDQAIQFWQVADSGAGEGERDGSKAVPGSRVRKASCMEPCEGKHPRPGLQTSLISAAVCN